MIISDTVILQHYPLQGIFGVFSISFFFVLQVFTVWMDSLFLDHKHREMHAKSKNIRNGLGFNNAKMFDGDNSVKLMLNSSLGRKIDE